MLLTEDVVLAGVVGTETGVMLAQIVVVAAAAAVLVGFAVLAAQIGTGMEALLAGVMWEVAGMGGAVNIV